MQTQILRYFGHGKEETFGTAVAAVQHVDIASTTLDVPTGAEIIIEGGMGRGALRKRPGFYAPSGNIEYTWDIRSIGWMLRYALGGYQFTAGSGTPPIHTHEIYGTNYNMLPSFTARLGKDVFEHVFTGCTINTLALNVTDNLASATLGVVASTDANAQLKEPADLILPPEYPMAFYEFTAKINNKDQSTLIRSFTVNIGNNINTTSGRTIGSRYPRYFRAGNRECSINLALDFEDLTYLKEFWGDESGPSGTGSSEISLEITGTASTDEKIIFTFPRCVILGIQTQPRGREAIVQNLSLQAMTKPNLKLADNATEVSTDIYVKLTNKQESML